MSISKNLLEQALKTRQSYKNHPNALHLFISEADAKLIVSNCDTETINRYMAPFKDFVMYDINSKDGYKIYTVEELIEKYR